MLTWTLSLPASQVKLTSEDEDTLINPLPLNQPIATSQPKTNHNGSGFTMIEAPMRLGNFESVPARHYDSKTCATSYSYLNTTSSVTTWNSSGDVSSIDLPNNLGVDPTSRPSAAIDRARNDLNSNQLPNKLLPLDFYSSYTQEVEQPVTQM